MTKASDKSGVNKLFWNVMVGITRSKVILYSKYIYIVVQYNYSMQSHHSDHIAGSFYSVVDWWTMLHILRSCRSFGKCDNSKKHVVDSATFGWLLSLLLQVNKLKLQLLSNRWRFVQTTGGYGTMLGTPKQSHEYLYSHSQSILNIVHPVKLIGIINTICQSYS